MKLLLVGDLHLTATPRDAYRWHIFDTLSKLVDEHKVERVVLLGDLTDEKDKHTARLVNFIVENIRNLSTHAPVHIVRGNHDGIDPEWPYFQFLNVMPKVKFYSQPSRMEGVNTEVLILPHSRNPIEEWSTLDFSKYRLVFAHVTVEGADSESGISLRSEVSEEFFSKRHVAVYAGDVHVPQRRGCVLYVGAPYPIRFGDSFRPRVLLLEVDRAKVKEKSIDLALTMARHMLDIASADELDVAAGDQIKVRLHLPSDMLGQWLPRRKAIISKCRALGADLVSIELVREEGARSITAPERKAKTALQVLNGYVDEHEIPRDRAQVGRDLLALVKAP